MRLLEFESKEILKLYDIPTPHGTVVSSPEQLNIDGPMMLKAQIPLGGRGKVGGVLEALSNDEGKAKVGQLLSTNLRGYTAKKILAEEKVEVAQEFFMGIVYDTLAKAPVAIFSQEGGVDIEELLIRQPEKVKRGIFPVRSTLLQYRSREIISESGLSGKLLLELSRILSRLAAAFLTCDATLAEINPLGLTEDGKLIALDCHMEIDDDAFFRHQEFLEKQRDANRVKGGRNTTEFERKAAEIDNLDHRGVAGRAIEFDGDLGLIIGGGGASLTAFDAVQSYGGRPANYCEIGGNPTVRKLSQLTKLVLSKPSVRKIAVISNVVNNTRADLVARGVLKGILLSGRVPSETLVVFRVPGAWEEESYRILSRYDVPYCDRTVSIDEAARIAVERMRD